MGFARGWVHPGGFIHILALHPRAQAGEAPATVPILHCQPQPPSSSGPRAAPSPAGREGEKAEFGTSRNSTTASPRWKPKARALRPCLNPILGGACCGLRQAALQPAKTPEKSTQNAGSGGEKKSRSQGRFLNNGSNSKAKKLASILCKSLHVDTDFHTSILFHKIIYIYMYVFIYTHTNTFIICVYIYNFFSLRSPFFKFSPFAITKARDRNTSWALPVQKHSHQTDFLCHAGRVIPPELYSLGI